MVQPKPESNPDLFNDQKLQEATMSSEKMVLQVGSLLFDNHFVKPVQALFESRPQAVAVAGYGVGKGYNKADDVYNV